MNIIETINQWAATWSAIMTTRVIDSTIVLLIVATVWFVIKKRAPSQLGYCLFLFVLVKLIIPASIIIPINTGINLNADAFRGSPFRADNNYLDQSAYKTNLFAGNKAAKLPETKYEERHIVSYPGVLFFDPFSYISYSSVFMLLWALGAGWLLIRFIINQRKFRCSIRGLEEVNLNSAPVDLVQIQRSARIKQPIRWYYSPDSRVPAVCGITHPTVIIPHNFFIDVSPAQAQWILLHELSHIRRRDNAVSLLQSLIHILFFFHPGVWIANLKVNQLREYACDDFALVKSETPKFVCGEGLYSMAQKIDQFPEQLNPSISLVKSQSLIRRRMMRILDGQRIIKTRLSVYSFVLLMFVMPVLLLSVQAIETIEQNSVSQLDPIGNWQSVDFVRNVEDFRPGSKRWTDDFFLKKVQLHKDGTSSIGITWKQGWIMHSDGRTKAQYYIKRMEDATYLFFPWLSGDVTIRGQAPWYYVLKKISDETQPDDAIKSKGSSSKRISFQTVIPITDVKEFDDVRWKDMSELDLSQRPELPATFWFNQKTVWPDIAHMPKGCDPHKLLSDAMSPGLGVRDLHKEGITGKGVNVGIIDQPLYQNHPEFAGKITAYHDVGCGSESSMHGPAVASLLVGNNCGTAPGAKVYYVAAPSWKKDAEYNAKALHWIIEQNEKLSQSEKIRVVSVSSAPSGPGSPFDKNGEMWDKACALAESQGLMVLDCTQHRGFIGPCYYDLADADNLSKCKSGFPGMRSGIISDGILVPCSPRTTAEEYNKGEHSFQYCGRGGLSWSIPYSAGVLALGWQLRPDLTAAQMKKCLFDSAYITNEGEKIINPKEFIRTIKNMP